MLNDFLIYYLELVELIFCFGIVIGDVVFFKYWCNGIVDFILDVVFVCVESFVCLFREIDNKRECLWVLRICL